MLPDAEPGVDTRTLEWTRVGGRVALGLTVPKDRAETIDQSNSACFSKLESLSELSAAKWAEIDFIAD